MDSPRSILRIKGRGLLAEMEGAMVDYISIVSKYIWKQRNKNTKPQVIAESKLLLEKEVCRVWGQIWQYFVLQRFECSLFTRHTSHLPSRPLLPFLQFFLFLERHVWRRLDA